MRLDDVLFLFQEVALDSTATTPEVVKFSILDIIIKGGPIGIVIVIALVLMGGYSVYVFVERYLTIRRASQIDDSFMTNIRNNVQMGNLEAAKQLCRSTDSPVARMIEKGLMRIGKPLRDINTAIENVGNVEIIKLENNLSSLATISGAAPMIGFLGTVTGMILTFYTMATKQNVTPDALAGGIYQALITTAFGLIVGILAFIGYNYLVVLVQKVVYQMESQTLEFMDFLQEPA